MRKERRGKPRMGREERKVRGREGGGKRDSEGEMGEREEGGGGGEQGEEKVGKVRGRERGWEERQ